MKSQKICNSVLLVDIRQKKTSTNYPLMSVFMQAQSYSEVLKW